uniref:HMA domain-containing protein n=1 Tax=Chenopodium quinoa TaxID=63459 RepID=A0A803N4M7_CHEQI
MHCEGCAKKVRRSIKNFNGVESIKTDCSAGKLTVVGKVDPVKIKERVEEKTKKKVELLSFQPNKPPNKEGSGGGGGGEKKSDGGGSGGGVQDVNVDLQKDTITVKGSMNMKEMLPYLNVKLKRNVELAAPAKKDEGAGGDKKGKEGGRDKEKPKEGGGGGGTSDKPKEGGEKTKGGGENMEGGGGGQKKDRGEGKAENVTKIEVNKMEYNPYAYGFGAHAYTYDPRQHGESSSYSHQVTDYWHEPEYSQPPQMFSDENPNACSIM